MHIGLIFDTPKEGQMQSPTHSRFAFAFAALVIAAIGVPAAGLGKSMPIRPSAEGTHQAAPGSKAFDISGGYYDPQRSIFVPSRLVSRSAGSYYVPQGSIYVRGTNHPE